MGSGKEARQGPGGRRAASCPHLDACPVPRPRPQAWAKPLPHPTPQVFRACGKVWAFARRLLVDWEAFAFWLMEAERAGREEQSSLGRRKRRELPHCSPSLKSLSKKPGAGPELRLLSPGTLCPEREGPGMRGTQGRCASGAGAGRAGAARGQRRGPEPGGRRGSADLLRWRGCGSSGAEGPELPGLPAPLGAGEGRVRARVRGGTDAGCGLSDGQDEVGRVGMGGEVLAWRPGGGSAGKDGFDLPRPSRDPQAPCGPGRGTPSRGRDLELRIQRLTEEAAYGLCRGSRGAGQGQRGGRSGLRARPPQAGTRGREGGGRSRGAASPLPPCAECCPQGAYSLMG